MKEYIKKFATPASADQYKIKDIPFITSVATNPIQNLHCNQKYNKLVNNNGIVTIESTLITFYTYTEVNNEYEEITYTPHYAESGSTFEEWVNNTDLNTSGFKIIEDDVCLNERRRILHASKDTVIEANHAYEINSIITPY